MASVTSHSVAFTARTEYGMILGGVKDSFTPVRNMPDAFKTQKSFAPGEVLPAMLTDHHSLCVWACHAGGPQPTTHAHACRTCIEKSNNAAKFNKAALPAAKHQHVPKEQSSIYYTQHFNSNVQLIAKPKLTHSAVTAHVVVTCQATQLQCRQAPCSKSSIDCVPSVLRGPQLVWRYQCAHWFWPLYQWSYCGPRLWVKHTIQHNTMLEYPKPRRELRSLCMPIL